MFRRLGHLFDYIFRRRRLERELDEELNSSFEIMVNRLIRQGVPAAEARRRARLDFEGTDFVKDRVRDQMTGATLDTWFQDVRYATRGFWKRPSFTAIAVLTLALGIGVNAAIFSVVYAVLLKPLPYERPDQLAMIWSDFETIAAHRAPTAGPIVGEIEHRTRLFQEISAMQTGTGTFQASAGEPDVEQVKSVQVSPNFLSLLGVHPALGRTFTFDEQAGGRPAIVLSDSVWRRRFGADPNIVGKAVRFNGGSFTVVGVLPEDFRLRLAVEIPWDIEVFQPFQYNIYQAPRSQYYLRVLGRMNPGVRVEQAQQEMTRIAAEIRGGYAQYQKDNLKLNVVGMQADGARDIRTTLIALFAGAGFVMLICCVNVANLLLARAQGRRKEISLRSALGASRARILRQLLTEGLILCLAAGIAGLGLGWAALHGLLRLQPQALVRVGVIDLNWPVLGFVAAVSMASVLLFALAPAIELARWDLSTTLRESGRGSHTSLRRGVRAILIVSEIAAGFILVIGAGLMIRTFEKIQQVRPGFDAQGVLTFSMNVPFARNRSYAEALTFMRDWRSQLATLPGVVAVGAISHLPLDNPVWYSPFRPEGVSDNRGSAFLADHYAITPGFLSAMGTRLLEGRDFGNQDQAGGQQVAIVDDWLASSMWPGQSAIGKRIESEHFTETGIVPVWAEIVGVVEHVRTHELSKKLRPEIFLPFEQSARTPMVYAVRSRVDPLSLTAPIREMLRKAAPAIPLAKVRPMTAYLDSAKAPVNFTALLAGIFGALALLLAGVGIYGVVQYSVSTRMHEMGVRMALGARGSDLKRMILKEGLILTTIGMMLGMGGAFAVSREFSGLTYGIKPVDPVSYGAAIVVTFAAALIGCWRPAWRAATANPVDAIRLE